MVGIKKHMASGGAVAALPYAAGFACVNVNEGGEATAQAIVKALGREGCAVARTTTPGRYHVWINCVGELGAQVEEWAAFGGSGDLFCEGGVIEISDPALPGKLAAISDAEAIPATAIKTVVSPERAAISEQILGKGRTWQIGVRARSLYGAVLRVRGDPVKIKALRAKGILSELSGAECDKVIDSALSKIAEQAALTFSDTDGATLAVALAKLGWIVAGDLRGSSGFFIPVDLLGRDHAVNNLEAYQAIDDINSNRSRDKIRATFLKENGRGPSPLRYSDSDWRVALSAVKARTMVDPFHVWLESRPKWDGVARISTLLADWFGAADTELNRWGSAQLLLGSVARTYSPGCKLDCSVVLVGQQDLGKSSLLAELFPRNLREKFGWFSDALDLSQSAKCQAESLERRVLMECSELSGRSKADLDQLKAFLTRVEDGGQRAAYATNPRQVLRMCIIVGTTNDSKSLPNDPTGLRRFLPVQLMHEAHVETLMEGLRDQLWAEAMAIWRARGIEGVKLPRGLRVEQSIQAEEHRDSDVQFEDFVLANPPEAGGSPLAFFMQHAALAGLPTHASGASNRMVRALRNTGHEMRRGRVAGKVQRLWFSPACDAL